MTEQGIVRETLVKIFKKNGYEELDRLTQRDFDHISHEIEENTGTLISGSTIKRLLNGNFSRLPQIATLDAISGYLGYKSWQEYKLTSRFGEKNLTEEKAIHTTDVVAENRSGTLRKFTLVSMISLIVGIVVIVVFIQFSDTKQLSNLDKASFSVRKNTYNEVPNTVVFNYNIDDVQADSFFIQQSWDKNRRVRIFKKNYTLTDIYYEPGYHVAKLIANDSIIRAVGISIPTDRWFLFAKDNPSSKPEYITADNIVKDGMLGINENDILKSKIDIGKEKEYLYTFFPSKIEVNSDNYVLKTKIRMKQVKNNSCPYIMLEVFTQRYPMFFVTTSRGCASESMLQFGEQFIGGKDRDLAPLSSDVTQWHDIELSVKNRQVNIFLDHEKVFTTSYKNTSLLIAGLGFVSNGICEIDFIHLEGSDGKIVYENNFDRDSLIVQ
jgi:hypothetical protein